MNSSLKQNVKAILFSLGAAAFFVALSKLSDIHLSSSQDIFLFLALFGLAYIRYAFSYSMSTIPSIFLAALCATIGAVGLMFSI